MTDKKRLNVRKLFQNDLRRSLAEDVKTAAVTARYHRTHGLAHRVERVYFNDPLLGHRLADVLITLTQFNDEPEQSTLGLVTYLLRQLALRLRHLHVIQTQITRVI